MRNKARDKAQQQREQQRGEKKDNVKHANGIYGTREAPVLLGTVSTNNPLFDSAENTEDVTSKQGRSDTSEIGESGSMTTYSPGDLLSKPLDRHLTEPSKEPSKEEPFKEPFKEPSKEPFKEPSKEPSEEPFKEPSKNYSTEHSTDPPSIEESIESTTERLDPLELVEKEEAVQAMAYYLSQCVDMHPESREMSPEELRAAVLEVLVTKSKERDRSRLLPGGVKLPSLTAVTYTLYTSYRWSKKFAQAVAMYYMMTTPSVPYVMRLCGSGALYAATRRSEKR